MKTWQRRLWKGFAAAFAGVVILLATLVGVFRLLAPLVPGYRAEVEKWAAAALDRPVSIAGMGARWDWYGPEITLQDVKLFSHDGKYVVVTAREVRLGVTLQALLHGGFSAPSRIILVTPHLSVVRDPEGHYYVQGFGNEAGQIKQVDWHTTLNDAFNQPAEIIVRDGSLRLLDKQREGAQVVFNNVDLKLDNAADEHSASGSMELPAAFGHSLTFDATIEGEGLHPEAWKWHVSLDGESLNLPVVMTYWPQYQQRFSSGALDVQAEISGDGTRLDRFKSRIDGRDLQLGTSPGQGFSVLYGNVEWLRSDNGWQLSGRDIRLADAHHSWPASSFQLVTSADSQSSTWHGSASYLDLQDLDTLLGWLPASLHDKLQRAEKMAPRGEVSELDAGGHWQNGELETWAVDGKFHDLGVNADAGFPGFTGLDGEIKLDQTGGTLQLETRDGSVTFPHLFRGPLYASTLDALFSFTHDKDGWRIASDNIAVSNPDGTATAKGSFLFPADGSSPQLDLNASVSNVDTRNKSAYFPVGIMPKPVVDWLDTSIIGGKVPQGTLSVHGRLADFPYDNGKGLFDIKFHLVDGVLDYAPGWPKIEALDADVEFRNQGLTAVVRSGNILGDDISQAKAGFADLREGVLRIDGAAHGSAQASLDFLRKGPLKERFGSYLDNVKVSGRSDVTLKVVLPVTRLDDYTLDGNAHLSNVNVVLQGAPGWALDKVKGDVHFSGKGVSADNVQGMMFGAPIAIRLHPDRDSNEDSTLFDAHGGADAPALVQALGLHGENALQGHMDWAAHGRIPNDPAAGTAGLSLTLHSDLNGLAVNLPAPFAKTADSTTPLDATLAIQSGGKTGIAINYAQQAAANLQFLLQDRQWRFDRGAIRLGAAEAELPEASGLDISGKLDRFDSDAWRPYFSAGNDKTGNNAVFQLPSYLQHVDLQVENFSGFGQNVNGLHLLLDRYPEAWRIELASAAIGGQISLPFEVDVQHPIIADMDHVTIQHQAVKVDDQSASEPVRYDPRRIPAVRFTSKLLQFSGVTLSQVNAVLTPRPDGISLADLSVDGRTFKAGAQGSWTIEPDGSQHSHLIGHVDSTNIKNTLEAFGYAPGITGDSAGLQADIDWQGGPFGNILPTLSGKLHIKLANGQLLEVKPGAGRVFGLLSVNALPRRLLLNFSDVFGTGFAYDSIEGNFMLQNGDAYTRDLTVSGPAAKIHVIGRIGLAKHDFDEALLVNASVGSSLPVIGALAGGVGVGAVVWLLTEVFKKPLTTVGEVRYRLTGSWDNPKLEKVAEAPKAQTTAPPAQATHP